MQSKYTHNIVSGQHEETIKNDNQTNNEQMTET